jgi:epoxyqueuosine reductase QueG
VALAEPPHPPRGDRGSLWQLRRATRRSFGPIGEAICSRRALALMRFVPSLPRFARARYLSPRHPWSTRPRDVPSGLRTVAGITRDSAAEIEAARTEPLQEYQQVHYHATNWGNRKLWRAILPAAPRLMRSMKKASATAHIQPSEPVEQIRRDELTRQVKEYAATIGMSAVGVARYDPKYTYVQYHGQEVGDRVIVCILEQNWKMTQNIPSAVAEQVSISTYAEVIDQSAMLAEFICSKGYRARAQGMHPHGIAIHYGVAAGLGQLGLNGQLLTPDAGSRCRIVLVDTDAPLVFDEPVDYGVPAICDACKACVRRCPSGAIPSNRKMYRGVLKAKINTARCHPVVAQAEGCAVCMRVCPVQRYGLGPVLDEFERSGKVLGIETDDLEGYDWPLDGKHYGPGERPLLQPEFFNPPEAGFDFTRKLPLTSDKQKTLI